MPLPYWKVLGFVDETQDDRSPAGPADSDTLVTLRKTLSQSCRNVEWKLGQVIQELKLK